MFDLPALLEGASLGTLTRADIEGAVDHCWRTRDFVRRVPESALPRFAGAGDRVERYGPGHEVITRRLYGEEGAPSCSLITTPCRRPYDRAFQRFLVAPHTHPSASFAVVTRGRALFLAVRDGALITADVGPGSVCFYPAGVPHTFVSDEEFDVVSVKAEYRDDFAAASHAGLDGIPRMTYEEYRGSV